MGDEHLHVVARPSERPPVDEALGRHGRRHEQAPERIESGRGLVEKHEAGVVQKRLRQAGALQHPLAVTAQRAIGGVEQIDTGEQAVDTSFEIETAHGGMSLARQEALYGPEFWKRDPEACCGIRKVKPMREALADCDAWVTGLRRDQSSTRADAKKIGDVYVTGLGLPSEMAGAIKSGATKEFAIWNPIDLGYSATQIAYHLVTGDADGAEGSEIDAGRMGKIKIGPNSEAAMSDPFVYDKSNIDEFSKIF